MLSIKDLAADKRDIVVKYFEHEVHISYRPSVINTTFSERIGKDQLAALLADVIDRWDVVGDDGEPYPLTADAISELPIAFQRRMFWEGVLDDNNTAGLPEVPAASAAS